MVQALAVPIGALLGVASTSTLATTVSSVILYAGTTAASYFIQQANQPKRDIGTKLRSASGGAVPMSFILGEKETAGSLIYQGTWGRPGKTPNTFYVRVYCLSDMPVSGFSSRLWVGGKKATVDFGTTNYTASDTATSGTSMGNPVPSQDHDGNHYMWVKFLDGTQTVADPYLREVFGGLASRPWTSGMIGLGRPLMIVTQRYTVKEANEVPEVVAVVRGCKLYDFRKDSTNGGSGSHRWNNPATWEYSKNAVLGAYYVWRGVYYGATWMFGGQNLAARRFDRDTWTAAANKCDENVSLAGGGTEKRYEIGGEISVAEEPLDVIDRILASCSGRCVEVGGIFKIYCGGVGAPVFSFTDDDIVITEALTGKMFPVREEICNSIAGTYIEPENGGQAKAYRKRTNPDYVAADGGEDRPKDMSFDLVRSNTQAQRVSLTALNDNRRFMTKVVAFPSVGRKLEPGDPVNWSDSKRFGFTNKKFILGDITLSDDGIVLGILREADASDSDWTTGNEYPNTVGVYGDIVPDTQTIVIAASAYGIKNNAGTYKSPGLKITWPTDADMVDCKRVRYKVRLLDTSYEVDAGTIDFDDGRVIITKGIEKNEVYQVAARIVPYSDRDTDWSAWQTVTANQFGPITDSDIDTTPPPDIATAPDVTNDAERDEDGHINNKITVAFDELPNPKLTYEIRVVQGLNTYYYLCKGSPRVITGLRTGAAMSFRVRAISAFGIRSTNLSPNRTYTSLKKSTPPAASTSLTCSNTADGTARYGKIVLDYDLPDDPDYAYTLIRRNNTGVFADGTTVVKKTKADGWTDGNLGNGLTRYYWVIHYDSSGNPSARYPAGAGRRGDTRSLVSNDIGTKEVKTDNLDNDATTTEKIKTGAVAGRGSAKGDKSTGVKNTKYKASFQLFKKKIAYTNRSGAPELVSVSGTLKAGVGQSSGGSSGGSAGGALVTIAFFIQRGSGKITTLAKYTASAPKKKTTFVTLAFRELLLAPPASVGAVSTVWAEVSFSGQQPISNSGASGTWSASCAASATVSFSKA